MPPKQTTAKKAASPAKTSRARAKQPNGWGGPAKGAGKVIARHVFTSAGPGRGKFSLAGEGRLERQARHSEEMRALYYQFAADPKREDLIRLKAATHLLDRSEGLPVQRVVQAQADPVTLMSDPELEENIQKQRKVVAEFERIKAARALQP